MLGFVRPDREGSGPGSGWLGFWMTSLHACISYDSCLPVGAESAKQRTECSNFHYKHVKHVISFKHLLSCCCFYFSDSKKLGPLT